MKPLSTPQANKEKIAALRQRWSTIKAMLDEIEKGNDGVGTAAASDVGSADQDFSIDASADEKNKTVFIHVPPFDMIPKQTQIEFVKAALDLLCKEDACDRAWADSPRTASSNTMCEIPGTDCSVDFFDLGCPQS